MKFWGLLDGLPAGALDCADPLDMPPAQRDVIIEHFARKAAECHFPTLAVTGLELMKPLSFIMSQGTLVAAPMLHPFFGEGKVNAVSAFLAERANVERLIEAIFAVEAEKKREGGAAPAGEGEKGKDR